MSTLQGFPLVSQLTTVTGDGRPSENAQFDCVAASIDAACRWLLGKPENSVFNPDNFKDQAYGEWLRNSGTSADKYVPFCETLGVRLFAMAHPDYAHAIADAHASIQHGFPVIFTRDDPYVDQRVHPDWTHVCCFFGEDSAGLTALDPYIGRAVYKSDAGWESVLRSSELWLAERIQETVTIDIHNAEIAKHYKEINIHVWQSLETGKVMQYAMLANYKTEGNKGLCGWDVLRAPVSNEIALSAPYPPRSTKQYYENGVRWWNAATGEVRPLALYDNGPGSDPRLGEKDSAIAELQALAASLQQQLNAAPDVAAVQEQLTAALQKLAQIKALAV